MTCDFHAVYHLGSWYLYWYESYKYFQEEDNFNFVWVGEQDGLEDEIATKEGIDFFDIPAGKIRRYFDWKNFYEPLKNLTGIFFGIYYILNTIWYQRRKMASMLIKMCIICLLCNLFPVLLYFWFWHNLHAFG